MSQKPKMREAQQKQQRRLKKKSKRRKSVGGMRREEQRTWLLVTQLLSGILGLRITARSSIFAANDLAYQLLLGGGGEYGEDTVYYVENDSNDEDGEGDMATQLLLMRLLAQIDNRRNQLRRRTQSVTVVFCACH